MSWHLCGPHSVHLDAGEQSSGQGTSRHHSAERPLEPPKSHCQDGVPPVPRMARYTCSRSWAGPLSSGVPNSAAVRKASRLGLKPGNTITCQGRGATQLHQPRPSAGPTPMPKHPPGQRGGATRWAFKRPPLASFHTVGDNVTQEKKIRSKPSVSNRNCIFISKKSPSTERKGSGAFRALPMPGLGATPLCTDSTGHRNLLIRPRKRLLVF